MVTPRRLAAFLLALLISGLAGVPARGEPIDLKFHPAKGSVTKLKATLDQKVTQTVSGTPSTVGQSVTLLRQQTDPNNNVIGLRAFALVVPSTQELTMDRILNSTAVPEPATQLGGTGTYSRSQESGTSMGRPWKASGRAHPGPQLGTC